MRVGTGWDRHRLEADLTLTLGGVTIPSPIGAVAHSDGDVLIHAIIDALLGAAALGDIGEHFPDTDPKYKGVSSISLLEKTVDLLKGKSLIPMQVDATVILEAPKLSPYKDTIQSNISQALNLHKSYVSIKAKTGEKIGPLGDGSAIEAFATVTLQEEDLSIWV